MKAQLKYIIVGPRGDELGNARPMSNRPAVRRRGRMEVDHHLRGPGAFGRGYPMARSHNGGCMTFKRHRVRGLTTLGVTLAAVLAVAASLGVAASPASAAYDLTQPWLLVNKGAPSPPLTHGYCLDADASQAYDGGGIIQWVCQDGGAQDPGGMGGTAPDGLQQEDPDQEWHFINVGNGLYQLKNTAGTGNCLSAGPVVGAGQPFWQWSCDASGVTGDPYELFYVTDTGHGLSIKNAGASDDSLASGGPPLCLDLAGYQIGNGSPIIEWPCNTDDNYQLWNLIAPYSS